MLGQCALYDIECELRQSHIIPKFAFEYLKKTGGRFLRKYDNPNQRIQDGPKKFLLSEQAEQEFSKRERWFANKVFFPYFADSSKPIDYDENLAYFAISILWRVLRDQLSHPSINTVKEFDFLKDVEKEWKDFLKSYTFPRTYNDLNIFLTDRVTSHNTDGIDVDLYLTRIVDATIVSNEKKTTVAVYVKFLRFVFWSVVKGTPNDSHEIKIKFTGGRIEIPQKIRDDFMGGFFQSRIKEVSERPKPSAEQQLKIAEEIRKTEDAFRNSDTFKSMQNDYLLKNST